MNVVALTGAGISAESGLKTFRDSDGLWENHRVEDVATPQAFRRNPALVLEFYNQRRRAVLAAQPNEGHCEIARWEARHRVTVVTQNIDDLHERAGSTNVIHLHGSILEGRSSTDPDLVVPWTGDMRIGDRAPDGTQIRPNVVWFGEPVPRMELAFRALEGCQALVIVGTSLQVYPAALLASDLPPEIPVVLVDPNPPAHLRQGVRVIPERASTGVRKAAELLGL
ncbi:MAG: NAD-dependent protein deacylase [Fimbriimonadales bacterium]|nr:NAD-dependent protein deacylase [Fimbriimonadales bacterium]